MSQLYNPVGGGDLFFTLSNVFQGTVNTNVVIIHTVVLDPSVGHKRRNVLEDCFFTKRK